MSQNIRLLTSEQIEAHLCKRLESVRLMKNLSQAKLAEEAGVSRRTISRMENGKGVSLDTFIRIMIALNLTDSLETLIPSSEIRPIERVQRKGQRKNASSPRIKKNSPLEKKWQWGN
ncbi:MAG: transcriptional regulator [Planctomycetaceae bacterium]|nr:transcriptional regulator [Planctomycetaceae bacterium]